MANATPGWDKGAARKGAARNRKNRAEELSQKSMAEKGREEMTKKHFIALADVMREQLAGIESAEGPSDPVLRKFQQEVARKQTHQIIEALAGFCHENGQFNRERWLGYIMGECGPCGGKIIHESY